MHTKLWFRCVERRVPVRYRQWWGWGGNVKSLKCIPSWGRLWKYEVQQVCWKRCRTTHLLKTSLSITYFVQFCCVEMCSPVHGCLFWIYSRFCTLTVMCLKAVCMWMCLASLMLFLTQLGINLCQLQSCGDVHRVIWKGGTVTCSWKVWWDGEAFPQLTCANLFVLHLEALCLCHYSVNAVLCRRGITVTWHQSLGTFWWACGNKSVASSCLYEDFYFHVVWHLNLSLERGILFLAV